MALRWFLVFGGRPIFNFFDCPFFFFFNFQFLAISVYSPGDMVTWGSTNPNRNTQRSRFVRFFPSFVNYFLNFGTIFTSMIFLFISRSGPFPINTSRYNPIKPGPGLQ